ncbi:Oxidation resistance protein 1 [Penicillium macrosclerotiorum]|uniref:Oxidation resistance protein 1 n=1 Tax=Penicillium macrosclerotiorum TaxID=303699 RepID=UPI002549A391|nr:Oxidation resistance protein 1 [Penicillium macrosclerotiorum]KAJ5692517.1 Oxidation resistance protein 1 [Penicillium macrosclerotiorum]
MSSSSQGDLLSDNPTTASTPSSTNRSGSHTPQQKPTSSYSQTAASYFSYPVTHVVSGLYRRLTDPNIGTTMPSATPWSSMSSSEVFTPRRTASPFQPPPLTPLTLTIPRGADLLQQQLLTRALAEEIRLLVPARLQLCENWRLAYSLDRDGASLATLYENCEQFSHRSPRAGYVLVIHDSSPSGTVFGAYMTDAPHPDSQFFGTGECFLWRASVLPPPSTLGLAFSSDGPQSEEALERAGLPPPPSADTTHAGRWSTFRSDPTAKLKSDSPSHNLNMNIKTNLAAASGGALAPPSPSSINTPSRSGASTPERIRFKAFPYSGVNDYMMFCETGFLSLGGGDGRYGLWVDSGLEKGVSAHCQTFGNEPLSDEGQKFDILGVEVWYVGS